MPRRKPKVFKSSSPEKEGSSESDQPQLQEEQGKQPGVETSMDGGTSSDHDGEAEQLPTAKRLKDDKEPGEEVTVENKAKSKSTLEETLGSHGHAKLVAEEDVLEEKPRARGKKKAATKKEKPSSQAKLEAEEELPAEEELLDEEELLEKKPRARGKKKAVTKEEKPSSQGKLEVEEELPAEEELLDEEELLEKKPRARGKKKAVTKEEKPTSQGKLEVEEELLEEKPRARGKKKAVTKEEKTSSQAKLEAEEELPAQEELLEEKPRARGKKKAVAKDEKEPVEHTKREESASVQSMPAVTRKPAKKKGKGEAVAKESGTKKAQTEDKAMQGRASSHRRYWLMKSEPESRLQRGVDMKFSIEDLQNEPDQTACWDGVRNYQARNFMRDDMKVGDLVFFYHSNCKDPGIAGESDTRIIIVEVLGSMLPPPPPPPPPYVHACTHTHTHAHMSTRFHASIRIL